MFRRTGRTGRPAGKDSTMLRMLITIAAVAAAFVLPGSALALHAPLDSGAYTSSSTTNADQPVNLLRDGKYAPVMASSGVQVVRLTSHGGFDFRDAGIGAGAVVAALALVALAGVMINRSRGRDGTRTAQTPAS